MVNSPCIIKQIQRKVPIIHFLHSQHIGKNTGTIGCVQEGVYAKVYVITEV